MREKGFRFLHYVPEVRETGLKEGMAIFITKQNIHKLADIQNTSTEEWDKIHNVTGNILSQTFRPITELFTVSQENRPISYI